MSHSPSTAQLTPENLYGRAFSELASKIRDGQSFSGRERNIAYLHTGKSADYINASYVLGLDQADDARGSAALDWDGDGDLDLALSNRSAPRMRLLLNQQQQLGHWLSLKLVGDVGKHVNRDAIGATVTVLRANGLPPLTRTVAAGDGFLSQSSLRLHFGLGPHAAPVAVNIRWPNGEEQRLSNMPPDAAWTIPQSQSAQPLVLQKCALQPVAEVPAADTPLHTRLIRPHPLPVSSYVTFGGETDPLPTTNGPTLLVLFSTECQHCYHELSELAKAKLPCQPIFLCLDRITRENITPDAARVFLKSTDWADATVTGWCERGLAEQLEAVIDQIVYRRRILATPLSFLLDSTGRVRSFCQGRSSMKDWQTDLKNLDASEPQLLATATPFFGLWASHTALQSNPPAVSAAWKEIGDPTKAIAVLEEYLAANASNPETNKTAEVSFKLADLLIHNNQAAKALPYIQSHPKVMAFKGLELEALLQTGQEAATNTVLQALQPSPAYPDALLLLAKHQAKNKAWAASLTSLTEATKRNPRFVPGLNEQAKLLATVPVDTLRDGPKAMQMVKFFLAAPGAAQNPEYLLTKALAEAEIGTFPQAAATLAAARQLAIQKALPALLGEIQQAEAAITKQTPWRQPGF